MNTTADRVSRGPCQGLRVLEFATMVSGPFAGQMLADLGAEVIKVEPLAGDPLRLSRPHHAGLGAPFSLFNRGKKSIGVDLKSAQGCRLARELALHCDVLLENYRPGVMERLGLDYASLSEANPGLVYLSISGFGPDGPYAGRPAYDHVIQAMSGTMPGLGTPEAPAPVRSSIVDKVAAMTALAAILAAVAHRNLQGGRGQKIDVSLLDAYAAFMLPDEMVNHVFQSSDAERVEVPATHYPVATADGHVMGHVYTDEQFAGLCALFGRAELLEDPRFRDTRSRRGHLAALWDAMREPASRMTTAAVVEGAARLSVPIGRINDLEDFFADPQVRHNATYSDVHDEQAGFMRHLRCPMRFVASPVAPPKRAPLLGEHTRQVLAAAGVNGTTIDAALRAGVVA